MGTDLDTILGVYTGATVGSLVPIGVNDEITGCAGGRGEDGSRVTFAGTGGTVYRVDVTGYGADQGSYYLRAYAGPAQARPQPDTAVVRRASLATALNTLETGPGSGSGQRQSASFALESVAGASFPSAHSSTGRHSPPARRRSPTTAWRPAHPMSLGPVRSPADPRTRHQR